MPDRLRQRRSPARFLAPLALLAVIAGIYLIVHHELAPAKHPTRRAQTQTATQPPAQSTTTTPGHGHTSTGGAPRYYVVKPGDNFDVISQRTGVSLQTIESLNPGVSATALRVGQRLTLRR